MQVPPLYTVFCLIVLGYFTVSKVEGWAMAGPGPGGSRGSSSGSSGSSSGFSYLGTSSGYHK